MRLPDDAIAACAAHAGVKSSEMRIAQKQKKGRNHLYVLIPDRASNGRAYFVKVRLDKYNPQHWHVDLDFDGLSYVLACGSFGAPFGAIEPIAYGLKPKWLATRYIEGVTLDRTVNEAILYGRNLEQARRYLKLIAQWLSAFRASATRSRSREFKDDISSLLNNFASLGRSYQQIDISRLTPLISSIVAEEIAQPETLAPARPTHGDMGAQNFIEDAQGIIYPFDFSAFGYRSLDTDLGLLRIRLEKQMFWGPGPRKRANLLWQDFWDTYIETGQRPGFCLFSYFHKLGNIMLKHNQKQTTARNLLNLRSGLAMVRDHLWIRNRVHWLADLPNDPESAILMMRTRL